MKLSFYGADQCVTGSCHCLEINDTRILIDCGLQQGRDEVSNGEFPFAANTIDYVLVTHAHIDHTGRIPLLVRQGFSGQIWTTRITARLMEIMLIDSAHIQQSDAEYTNRKNLRAGRPLVEPLYTIRDAELVQGFVHTRRYNVPFPLCEGVTVTFSDAGHLLGSSSITMDLTENGVSKTIVFSGDIGNLNQPILRDPVLLTRADYVVMESTYGDRLHATDRPDYVHELAAILKETFDRGGNVVIPSFAVGRTQELLYFLRRIKVERLVKGHEDFPVYVDSPLAVEATEIFQENRMECFAGEALELVKEGINPISFAGLKLSITSDESREINFIDTPKVIISASGMCEAGRIRHHLKHNLWRPECTILFVGYQAVGTLGRMIVDGVDEVKLFGESIQVRAEIKKLVGMSGHADKNGLIEWVCGFQEKPRKIFVVHGEDSVCAGFAECLKMEYGQRTYAPYSGTVFDLLSGKLEYEAEPVPVKKKAKGALSTVYARLLAAAQRLLNMVKRIDGMPNKDMGKFADQINSLCDKWEA